MQSKLPWTLLALGTLAGTASADVDIAPAPITKGEVLTMDSGGSRRGVSQDYMVLPSGGELTGSMRFITAEALPGFGEDEKLRFSDLALFTVGGRYSLFSKLELSASGSFLAKQTSATDEKPWQSVGVGLRSPIGKRVALAISGSGGHLIDHEGSWIAESLMLQWRKPIAKILTFDVAGGIEGIGITAPKETNAFMTELSVTGSALFREPHGHWGAWVGMGYALPVHVRGVDPTTDLPIDPQARLDFRIGTVISLNKWDLFAELAIVDRGDHSNPATRLPVLDGGFDQRQIILGVTRHIEGKKKQHHGDDAYEMAAR
jgi:hypothetical protein